MTEEGREGVRKTSWEVLKKEGEWRKGKDKEKQEKENTGGRKLEKKRQRCRQGSNDKG